MEPTDVASHHTRAQFSLNRRHCTRLASIPAIQQWLCTRVGGYMQWMQIAESTLQTLYMFSLIPAPPIVTVANSSCARGKPRAACQSTSLDKYSRAILGLVDFFIFADQSIFFLAGPFLTITPSAGCRISGSAIGASADQRKHRLNISTISRTIGWKHCFLLDCLKPVQRMMSSCNPAFRKESGVSSDQGSSLLLFFSGQIRELQNLLLLPLLLKPAPFYLGSMAMI